MCLIINKSATARYKSRHKNKKRVYVYKEIVYCDDDKFYTPYQSAVVYDGFFKANKVSKDYHKNTPCIYGGAIHCYRKPNKLYAKCWAYMSDFIAVGYHNHICFKKIFIPKSELKRLRGLI